MPSISWGGMMNWWLMPALITRRRFRPPIVSQATRALEETVPETLEDNQSEPPKSTLTLAEISGGVVRLLGHATAVFHRPASRLPSLWRLKSAVSLSNLQAMSRTDSYCSIACDLFKQRLIPRWLRGV
jgi:hypothetical protein